MIPVNPFKKGDLIKLSEEGCHLSKTPDKIGTIISISRQNNDLVWVMWDGRNTKERYHHKFLAPAAPKPNQNV
jgi:hypothetical protein